MNIGVCFSKHNLEAKITMQALIDTVHLSEHATRDLVWYVRFVSEKNKILASNNNYNYPSGIQIQQSSFASLSVDPGVRFVALYLLRKIAAMTTPLFLPLLDRQQWSQTNREEGMPKKGLIIEVKGVRYEVGSLIGEGAYAKVYRMSKAGSDQWNLVLKLENSADHDIFWGSSWREYAVLKLLNQLKQSLHKVHVPNVLFWSCCDTFDQSLLTRKDCLIGMDFCGSINFRRLLDSRIYQDRNWRVTCRRSKFKPIARSYKELEKKVA